MPEVKAKESTVSSPIARPSRFKVHVLQLPETSRNPVLQSVSASEQPSIEPCASTSTSGSTSLPDNLFERKLEMWAARIAAAGFNPLQFNSTPEHPCPLPQTNPTGQPEPLHESPSAVTCPYHLMQVDSNVWWVVLNPSSHGSHSTTAANGTHVPSLRSIHSTSSGPICRICFMGPEEGALLRVCHCRGSVGLVHQRCLRAWTFQRQNYYCEICQYAYSLRVRGLQWCWKWSCPIPAGQLCTQVSLFIMSWIVMVFSISSLFFIALNLNALFPDEVTAVVFIVMNSFTLLCSLAIMCSQTLYPIRNFCQRFCMANLDIEVLPYENNTVNEADTQLVFLSNGDVNPCTQEAVTRNTGRQVHIFSSPNLSESVNGPTPTLPTVERKVTTSHVAVQTINDSTNSKS